MPRITPNLWFDDNGKEAAEFYVSDVPELQDHRRHPLRARPAPGNPARCSRSASCSTAQPFTIINGGPQFTFDEAVSFEISCADQAEIDYYWDTLTADGGEESQCGWLKDRFGLSWQVVPEGWEALFDDADPARADRAMQAMLGMQKLDIAALEAAADGATV